VAASAPVLLRLRLAPRPRAYRRFEIARQSMLAQLSAWITEDQPPSDLIAHEVAATGNAIRQIAGLIGRQSE
jgi:hypothetical protein